MNGGLESTEEFKSIIDGGGDNTCIILINIDGEAVKIKNLQNL